MHDCIIKEASDASEGQNESLSAEESARLTELEAEIENHGSAVGVALKEIHDKRLYRAEYRTWAGYCEKRWRRTRSWGYRLVDFERAKEQCRQSGDTPPRNQGSFRAGKQKQKVAKQSEIDRPAGQAPKAAPKQKRTQRKSAVKVAQPEQPEQIANELEEEPENVRIIITGPDEEFEGFKEDVEAWKAEFTDYELRPLLEQVREYVDEMLASLPEQELEGEEL